ncbi:RNA polymerase sigma factor [Bacillus sp. FJAT-49736]|uniref:RNA polymerase sigma factor n=1 Tax=Bacillus sp. FJAT-49736 TaxID=2833582 RepID=UPI001BC96932|nr:RNA polymerase sigma factor [Bacillus sp. FJAT-49736]MBS4174689.1 sigma-70 family RNA polymerase sigma factor [Bacillus sp. FJAT-49736]
MKKSKLEPYFVQFITENKEDFYRLAYSYVKNQADALDIVQDSIKKGLLSLDSMRDKRSIKSWFYRIVVNTSLDYIRKKKKVTFMNVETLDYFSSGKEDVYKHFDLERSLEALPEKYRRVIVLRYFEDLKIEEVAEVLDENESTIKTRIYRALDMLRIKLK